MLEKYDLVSQIKKKVDCYLDLWSHGEGILRVKVSKIHMKESVWELR